MVTHCNSPCLLFVGDSAGGLCLNHGYVGSYFRMGPTIATIFGGETKVTKRRGGFCSCNFVFGLRLTL